MMSRQHSITICLFLVAVSHFSNYARCEADIKILIDELKKAGCGRNNPPEKIRDFFTCFNEKYPNYTSVALASLDSCGEYLADPNSKSPLRACQTFGAKGAEDKEVPLLECVFGKVTKSITVLQIRSCNVYNEPKGTADSSV